VRDIYEEDLVRLRDEVARRYGFRIMEVSSGYINGSRWQADDSPLIPSFLPRRGQPGDVGYWSLAPQGLPKNRKKPKTVRLQLPRERWDQEAWAIIHEMSHLALWHGEHGVWKANEADCVVLEAAWADDILGRGWGQCLALELDSDVGLPYAYGYGYRTKYSVRGDSLSAWKRPRAAWWWKHETDKLKRLGVLNERGKPTYKVADWRGLGSWREHAHEEK